jgi:mono/diheme cytochrome c family protein
MVSQSSRSRPQVALKLAALVMLSAPTEHHPSDIFEQLLAMHRAVVRADLPALHSPAVWFMEHGSIRSRTGEPDPEEEVVKLAAARAAAATDVSRAAAAVADVVVACGGCHRARRVTLHLSPIVQPRHTNIVGHMQRHEQAAEQMLHGLVIPSDSQWLQGTTAFAETPLAAGDFPVDFERGDKMARVETEVHRLAQNAFAAETPSARARAYAQLLGTCAGCHQSHARP